MNYSVDSNLAITATLNLEAAAGAETFTTQEKLMALAMGLEHRALGGDLERGCLASSR